MASSATKGSGQFTGGQAKTRKPSRMNKSRTKGGEVGEIAALREDLSNVFGGALLPMVEEFTDVPALDDDGIKTSIATVAAITEYSGAALNGAVGAGTMTPPRNIIITTGGVTPANAPATATITGYDVKGRKMTETITVAQTAAVATGVKCFARVTKINLPAADGVAATLKFGFGALFGLAEPVRTRAGARPILFEVEAGTVVTTGSLSAASTNAPHGAYTPATVPNGTNDYAISYERDVALGPPERVAHIGRPRHFRPQRGGRSRALRRFGDRRWLLLAHGRREELQSGSVELLHLFRGQLHGSARLVHAFHERAVVGIVRLGVREHVL